MSIFEIIMLICFGAAWPFSIYKSYTSWSVAGKSLQFLIVLLFGYTAGVIHKILYSFDYVIILYILNFVMVFTDVLLYLRNKRATNDPARRATGIAHPIKSDNPGKG